MCPKRWEAKYINRVNDPPNEFTFFGLVDHKAKELYFQKQIDGEDPDKEVALDLFESVWNGDFNTEDFDVDRNEVTFFAGEEGAFSNGLSLFEKFLKRIKWKPAAVEMTFERVLDFSYIKTFISRVDMITDKGVVVDFKTTFKNVLTAYNPAEVKYHMQPTSNAYAMDTPIDFEFVISQRRERKIYTRGTKRTQQDIDWMDDVLIPKVVAQIESGIYPAAPGKHCEYCPIKMDCGYRL